MSKLAALKRNKGNNLKKLQEQLEKANQSGAPRDERIWKPKFNKEKGKGTCIIRFLTPVEGDAFVEMKSYQFNGPGGNFWGNALQTIGEKDPVQIAAINAFKKAKAEGDERLKTEAKKFLPKSQFFAWVYVIKDEEAPENEGQVKIFQFGRQIYGFIEKAIQPEFDDVDPMDPFDLWEGADFKIRMVGREIPDSRTGNKILVPNYENSEFGPKSEFLGGDEDELEAIVEKTSDLSEFISADKFKSFDEVAKLFKDTMKKPYNWLSSEGVEDHVKEQEQERQMDEEKDDTPDAGKQEDKSVDYSDNDEEDDDPLARFRKLASGN